MATAEGGTRRSTWYNSIEVVCRPIIVGSLNLVGSLNFKMLFYWMWLLSKHDRTQQQKEHLRTISCTLNILASNIFKY